MQDKFLSFQKFNDVDIAEAVGQKLFENGIEYIIENDRKYWDPSFANNSFAADIILKIEPQNFINAHKILDDFYKIQVEYTDNDYYLNSFTDDELFEIISKPDEWGHFDYQLAQKLLKERGKEVPIVLLEQIKNLRIKDLSKPETSHKYFIYIGYFSAIMGGLFGLFIGWNLAYFKKTLPDGKRVFVYREDERNHGIRMILISFPSMILWLIFRWAINKYYF